MLKLLVTENAGFEIIDRVIKKDVIYVLAKKELDGLTKYATWATFDGKGFDLGHYFHDYHNGEDIYSIAYEDMMERAGYVKKDDRSAFDKFMEEEIVHRVEEFEDYWDIEKGTLSNNEQFMAHAENEIYNAYCNNDDLGDLINNNLQEACYAVFGGILALKNKE